MGKGLASLIKKNKHNTFPIEQPKELPYRKHEPISPPEPLPAFPLSEEEQGIDDLLASIRSANQEMMSRYPPNGSDDDDPLHALMGLAHPAPPESSWRPDRSFTSEEESEEEEEPSWSENTMQEILGGSKERRKPTRHRSKKKKTKENSTQPELDSRFRWFIPPPSHPLTQSMSIESKGIFPSIASKEGQSFQALAKGTPLWATSSERPTLPRRRRRKQLSQEVEKRVSDFVDGVLESDVPHIQKQQSPPFPLLICEQESEQWKVCGEILVVPSETIGGLRALITSMVKDDDFRMFKGGYVPIPKGQAKRKVHQVVHPGDWIGVARSAVLHRNVQSDTTIILYCNSSATESDVIESKP